MQRSTNWLRRRMIKTTLLAAIFWIFPVLSAFNVYEFENQVQEKQFTTLIDELRCPKCQNNNLSDSNAPLATDIKNYVYQSVKSGKSNDEITQFLVSRYGEFVTYRPRNWLIWAFPTLVGLVALGLAIYRIRRRTALAGNSQSTESALPTMASIIDAHEKQQESR